MDESIGAPSPADRVQRLADPERVKRDGYGRGKTHGEAFYRCAVAITGYPYRGTGLHSALARWFGVTPAALAAVRTAGAVSVAPLADRLGLAIVRLGPNDVVVCHPSRLGWWNTGDAAGYTTAPPPNPKDMP